MHWFTKNIKKMSFNPENKLRELLDKKEELLKRVEEDIQKMRKPKWYIPRAKLAFGIGDLVRVPGNIKGKIVNWFFDANGNLRYEVEFSDKTLIPPVMDYSPDVIKLQSKERMEKAYKSDCECGLDATYGKDHKLPARAHDPFCPKFRRN
jgi:hypothetical protein